MRSVHGAYTRIDSDTVIRVIYLRATPLRVAQSKAQNRATTTTGCVAELRGSHAVVAGRKVPTALTRAAEETCEGGSTNAPPGRTEARRCEVVLR